MKKILEIALGIVTSVGGFLEIGSIATAAQAGSDFSLQLIWAIVLGGICATLGFYARLNNLPANAEPTNYKDAIARFQAPKSIVLIIPGEKGRVSFPKDAKINAAHVEAEAKPLFEAWGGAARLRACAAKLETGRAKK